MSKKEDILTATLDLITEEGLQSVTFSKIFKRANVGSGTFYNYFENKEQLVNELFGEICVHMNGFVIIGYNPNGTVYERFKHLMKNTADFALQFPKELSFLENYYHSPYISDEVRNMHNSSMEECLAVVAEGQRQGLIREFNPAMCCSIATGLLLSVIKDSLSGKFELGEPQVQETIEACWKAIRL